MEQSLQELRTLLKSIELIRAQHINYVDRLKKSLRSGEAFLTRNVPNAPLVSFSILRYGPTRTNIRWRLPAFWKP
ncbi:MAG: hypothetical protein P3W89_000055 [Aquificaceae bacterium]|nr:hypothetical protein [Aquificaceae bacterium]